MIGLKATDTQKDIEYIAKKILALRLFPAEGQEWKRSICDVEGEILCVSQFTLYANTKKGAKPDLRMAMRSIESKELYNQFLELLKSGYPKVQDGEFGAMMDVSLINDGPCTIVLDSPE